QNWLALHNTPTVSAHQKRADRVFRFEYGEHFLAVQRIRSSDASAQVSVFLAVIDLVIAPVRYRPAGLLFNELLDGLIALLSNFAVLYGQKKFHAPHATTCCRYRASGAICERFRGLQFLGREPPARLDAPSRLPKLRQTHNLQSLGPTQRDGVLASCEP